MSLKCHVRHHWSDVADRPLDLAQNSRQSGKATETHGAQSLAEWAWT